MTLPDITNKQQEILGYLYHFRFLNRIQIQALLKHKDYKTINLWLKDLTEKEYTNRIYSRKYGKLNKPAIYYIGPNGIKYLRTKTNCPRKQINKLWREKDRSGNYISNCQYLADVYLNLKSYPNEKVKYSIKTKSEFINPDSPLHFLIDTGCDMLIEQSNMSKNKYYLLHILDHTLPGYSIKKRIKSYFDLYYSNQWEDSICADFPTIILICENMSMAMSIKKLIKWLDSENGDQGNPLFQISTKQEFISFDLGMIISNDGERQRLEDG